MKKHQLSIDEAVRVVGHLLEHHPTTHAGARDVLGAVLAVVTDAKACSWCLTGAIVFVARTLIGTSTALELVEARAAEVLELTPGLSMPDAWDHRGPEWRAEAVEKLKCAGLSTEA